MIEKSIVYRNFKGKYEYFSLGKAQDAYIWDRNNNRYIDFSSGWNVTNLGWNHPEVNKAIAEQTQKNTQGLLWGSDPIQEEYAKELTSSLPKDLDACIKSTSGTEAIEVAIKVARSYTQRKKIIGFSGLYHGQLFASLALGGGENDRAGISPLVPEITRLNFPHNKITEEDFQIFLKELETILSEKEVAAIVTEPCMITGWGSCLIAYPGFLKNLRILTEKYSTLLIIDEVGTGFSRTGKLFGIEHENIIPDMIALAKGISNGASAIGTVVGKSSIFEPAFDHAFLISTFGWNPVACAAALATLQIHKKERTWELSSKKGEHIQMTLKSIDHEAVVDVRGMGMEIGLQCKNSEASQALQKACFQEGLNIVVGSGDTIQIMPPLTISDEVLQEGLDILIRNIKKM